MSTHPTPVHPDQHFIQVGELTISYFDLNPTARGLPLLFIHGYNGSGYEAIPLAGELREHRIIAPDWPGSGYSSKPTDPSFYRVSSYTPLFIELMERLDIPRYLVIGHSLGGRLASHLAASAPDRIPALVLIGPYGFAVQDDNFLFLLTRLGPLVDLGFSFNNPAIARTSIKQNAFTSPEAVPEDYLEYVLSSLFEQGGNEALKLVTKHLIHDGYLEDVLPKITQPVLLLWGRDDRVMRIHHAPEFTRRLGLCYFYSMAHMGHMPHMEAPHTVARYIEDFLERVVIFSREEVRHGSGNA